MPVTLYRDQWERLLKPETVSDILAFITEHQKELKAKQ